MKMPSIPNTKSTFYNRVLWGWIAVSKCGQGAPLATLLLRSTRSWPGASPGIGRGSTKNFLVIFEELNAQYRWGRMRISKFGVVCKCNASRFFPIWAVLSPARAWAFAQDIHLKLPCYMLLACSLCHMSLTMWTPCTSGELYSFLG